MATSRIIMGHNQETEVVWFNIIIEHKVSSYITLGWCNRRFAVGTWCSTCPKSHVPTLGLFESKVRVLVTSISKSELVVKEMTTMTMIYSVLGRYFVVKIYFNRSEIPDLQFVKYWKPARLTPTTMPLEIPFTPFWC